VAAEIRTQREGAVLRVRLARPDRRNALSASMCGALSEAMRGAGLDGETRAILLESEGPVFSAGSEEGEPPGGAVAALFGTLESSGIPIVAAVQGPAFGAGVALIALAHVAVAAQGATFAMNEIRTGRFPAASCRALARAIGDRRAVELCLTGRQFALPEAVAWGLVHHAAPVFEYDDRACAIAEALAAMDRGAVLEGLRLSRSPAVEKIP
jgi:methylglutaconyl-CoA hydratase